MTQWRFLATPSLRNTAQYSQTRLKRTVLDRYNLFIIARKQEIFFFVNSQVMTFKTYFLMQT